MICPNINSQEWKALEGSVGKQKAYELWVSNNYEIPDNYTAEIRGNEHYPFIIDAVEQTKQNTISMDTIDRLNLSDEHKTMAKDLLGAATMTRQEFVDELTAYAAHVTPQGQEAVVEKQGDQWAVIYPGNITRYFNEEAAAKEAATPSNVFNVVLSNNQIGFFEWEGDQVEVKEGGRPVLLAAAYHVFKKVGEFLGLPEPAFLRSEPTRQEVYEKLTQLLQDSGISLMSIEQWEEMTGNKAASNARALADITNKIIAVKDGKISPQDLAEELAHFVIGAQKGPELETMLALVKKTQEWQQNAPQYMEQYQNDKPRVQLEILGKILAEQIIRDIKSSAKEGPLVRIISMLRRAWKNFMNRFIPTDALKDYIKNMSRQTLNTGLPASFQVEGIFYAVDPLSFKDNFDGIIESIEQRIESLRRRNKGLMIDGENITKLKYELEELKEYRRNLNYGAGYTRFLEYLLEDMNSIMIYINKVRLGLKTIGPSEIMAIGDFVAYYEPYMDEILKFLNHGDVSVLSDDQIDFLANIVEDKMIPNFRVIRHFRDIKREEQFLSLVKDWWAQELKLDQADPEFIERVKEATGGYDLEDAARRMHSESHAFDWWFGSIRDASDKLLRLIYSKILRVDQKVHILTVDFAKDLANKAAELGIKDQDRFLERINGKRSGFYIERTKRREWEQSKRKFFGSLYEKYNIPTDPEARKFYMEQWKEQANLFPDTPEGEQYQLYRKEVSEWYKKNTIQKADEEINRIMTKRQRELSDAQYKEWENRNIIKFIDRNGNLRTVFSGELVEPSDGSTVGVGRWAVTTVDWRNKDFAKLSNNEKEFLEYLVAKKEEVDAKLPNFYDNHQAPQLTDRMIDIVRKKRDRNIVKKLRDNVVDEITARGAEDDAIFGEKTLLRPDGSKARYVPIYYTKLLGDNEMSFEERLEETDKIGTDLINGLVAYHEMAERWNQMSKIAPELELIAEQAGKREFQKKNGERVAGSETNIAKQLRTFLDMQVYGMKLVGGDNWIFQMPENAVLEFVGLSGKKISAPKMLKGLANYVRMNNLGFNFFTTASNFVQSYVFTRIEDLVKQYTSARASLFAEEAFWKNIFHVIGETGQLVKTNKMYLLMEAMGIQGDPAKMFRNTDMTRLSRRAVETGLFTSYEMIEFWRSSRVMLAVMYNYRQDSDGKWYNEREYKKKFPEQDFEKLPNLYDLSRVTMDGKIDFPIPMEEFNKLAGRVRFVNQTIDGRLDKLDYAAAHQHFVAQLMTIHRGWLISGLYRRLKSRGINVATGDIEEGYWLTTWNFMKKTFASNERINFIRQGIEEWHNLSDVEQQNLMRMIYEIAFALIATSMAILLNGIADDDDEYINDVVAYMSNRVLMEIGAFVPPIFISEISNTLANPIVPMRHIELMFDYNDIFFGSEEVESGQWKGFTKRERALYRLIPGVKGLALFRDPKSANQFLKNKPLRSVPYSLYGN